MLKTPLFALLITLFTLIVAQNAHSENTPQIVTSITPLSLITAEILGAEENITTLVPPGSNAHHFQLKPSHVKALRQADLIVWIGPSLEGFMSKPLKAPAVKTNNIITIETLPELQLLPYRSSFSHQHHHHGHTHDAGIDGHLWLSPDNAIHIAKAIKEQLAHINPKHRATYQNNLENFIKKIQITDNKITTRLHNYKDTPYLVYHNAFQYFERHYQLNSQGSFIGDNNTPLSVKRLKHLQQTIHSAQVQCIFADNQYNQSIPQKVANKTGVHLQTLDPVGSGITFENGGYTRLLETIAENMLSCFKKPSI